MQRDSARRCSVGCLTPHRRRGETVDAFSRCATACLLGVQFSCVTSTPACLCSLTPPCTLQCATQIPALWLPPSCLGRIWLYRPTLGVDPYLPLDLLYWWPWTVLQAWAFSVLSNSCSWQKYFYSFSSSFHGRENWSQNHTAKQILAAVNCTAISNAEQLSW